VVIHLLTKISPSKTSAKGCIDCLPREQAPRPRRDLEVVLHRSQRIAGHRGRWAGTDVIIFKTLRANIWRKMAIFAQTAASFGGKLSYHLFLRKTPFSAENCDHNIDPGSSIIAPPQWLKNVLKNVYFPQKHS
jgi:hypothetical protein